MRGENRWRVIGILPAPLRGCAELSFDDVIPHVRHEAGATLSFTSCSWFSTYQIHHRRAAQFQERRCFLLGDAAHVHSPMGAQGMNTGLQDAYNLAWKLDLVVTGQASDTLLGTYARERMPVAQRLLRTTDRAFMLVVSDNFVARLFRTQILARFVAFAMRRPSIRQFAFRAISQIGIRYRDSPLSRTLTGLPQRAPRAGDRFPWLQLKFNGGEAVEDLFQKLDDTCFNLIFLGQQLPPSLADGMTPRMRAHEVPDDAANTRALARAHIPVPSYFLLRPDGHIGLAGIRIDSADVMNYLRGAHIRCIDASRAVNP
jgi:hypothetical protein